MRNPPGVFLVELRLGSTSFLLMVNSMIDFTNYTVCFPMELTIQYGFRVGLYSLEPGTIYCSMVRVIVGSTGKGEMGQAMSGSLRKSQSSMAHCLTITPK